MKPLPRATSAIALVLALTSSSAALAQDEEPTETGGELDDGQFSGFLTTTSAATASSGGASSAAMATMVAYTPDPEGRLSMALYLTQHARGVRDACALGAGYVVDDLALALALDASRRADLARALRARREHGALVDDSGVELLPRGV